MRFVCLVFALTLSQSVLAVSAIVAPKPEGHAIDSAGFNALLEKQIKLGTLKTENTANGFHLFNEIQNVAAVVNQESVVFKSIGKQKDKGEFSLSLIGWGRESGLKKANAQKLYREGDVVFHARDGITERFTNTGGGIRQDFIIDQKPKGEGELYVQLRVDHAKLKTKNTGVIVTLNDSNRELTYDRLAVTDSTGQSIPASIKIKNKNTLDIVVNDAHAKYPLTIDPTVGDEHWVSMGGINGASGTVYSIVTKGSDVYVAGNFKAIGNILANRVAKWNGSEWVSLGSGIEDAAGVVYSLVVDSLGNVYVGGEFTNAGGVATNNVAKWDGSNWSALDSGIDGGVNALAVNAHNHLFVGGYFTNAGGVAVNSIAKWDGNSWSALGSGVSGNISTLLFDANGKLYVGGGFSSAGGVNGTSALAVWDGSTWKALAGGTLQLGTSWYSPHVETMVFDGVGNLYVGGFFELAGGKAAKNVAKWKNGTWSALGDGIVCARTLDTNCIYAMSVDSSNNLYVGGSFSFNVAKPDEPYLGATHIAKWNISANAWEVLGDGIGGMNINNTRSVQALSVTHDGTLYVGGIFNKAGNASAQNFAKWSSGLWSGIVGQSGKIFSVVFDGVGKLYAAGNFTTIGGIAANSVAVWDGSAWSPLGDGITCTLTIYYEPCVKAMAVDSNGNLYVAADGHLTIQKWNGANWSYLYGIFSSDYIYAMAVDSANNLYVAGKFTSIEQQFSTLAVKNIAKWDGSSWSALGSGITVSASFGVYSLAIDKADNVYAGGYFSSAGGLAVNNIARWNGSAWSALGSGIDGEVYTLALDSGNNLYAGGQFDLVGGTTANNIARWDGNQWSGLGAGINGKVFSLKTDSSDNLYVAGQFTQADNITTNNIAKWDGANWSALGSGGVECYSIRSGFEFRADSDCPASLAVDTQNNIYVVGGFLQVGDKMSAYIAKWQLIAPSPTPIPTASPTPTPTSTVTPVPVQNITISAKAGTGGMINPSGSISVAKGSDVSFEIAPILPAKYEINNVKVDGVSLGAITTYIFSAVEAKHKIQATFKIRSYNITVINEQPILGKLNFTGVKTLKYGKSLTIKAKPLDSTATAEISVDGNVVVTGSLPGSAVSYKLFVDGEHAVSVRFF